jgi:uncharacterized protein affecting Mg2+/Co2+ transport
MVSKKTIQKALEQAKNLEKQEIPPEEEIVRSYKEDIEKATNLAKLLKPSWWISDTHKKPTRKK